MNVALKNFEAQIEAKRVAVTVLKEDMLETWRARACKVNILKILSIY